MKYRKKAASIEAFQYDGDFMNSNGEYYVPQWAIIELKFGNTLFYNGPKLMFEGKFGSTEVDVGDYIVKDGVELMVFTEECFNKIYERVE